MNWVIAFDINTLPCVKQTASENLWYTAQELGPVLCDDLVGGMERVGVKSKRDAFIWKGNLLCCMAEASTTL